MAYYLARNLSSSFLSKDQRTERYSYASTGQDRALGLLEVEAYRFQNNRYMKVVSL